MEFKPVSDYSLESLDTRPKVEHLLLANSKDVLIKTSFPRDGSVVCCYILIQEPTSEESTNRINQRIESLEDEVAKSATVRAFEDMNKPLVFKGLEQAQIWFDFVKDTFDFKERARIAAFLAVEDTDN